MKCFWCKQDTPDKDDKFEMCASCYTKTLDGFTLIECTNNQTECKVNNKYLTGRFVVVNREVIKDIVINNKSEITCKVKTSNGRTHTSTIRTTFIQRHAMKQVFTLDVLKVNRAVIDDALFQKFMNKNEIKRVRK